MRIVNRLRIGILLWLATSVLAAAQQVITVHGDTGFVHDPSIIREGGSWYLFSTTTGRKPEGEIPVRCSLDLHQWNRCGHVFEQIPDWIKQESPGTKNLWAPDISFFNGEYHLYYAYSLFGKNTSGIALVTNKTLDHGDPKFRWEDRGLVLRSRAEDDFNAIDPNVVSFDLCCRGTHSNYKTMVGRSREVTGPYVDANGTPMLEGGGTPVLVGNNHWLGPGGESIRMRTNHGGAHDLIVFHAYDSKTGAPYLQISIIRWSHGWPHAALAEADAANR